MLCCSRRLRRAAVAPVRCCLLVELERGSGLNESPASDEASVRALTVRERELRQREQRDQDEGGREDGRVAMTLMA